MGNRFNQSLIHQPLAYLLLTPMMAIALGLGCDREMVMAQSPPMPVMPPTDHDGAIELDSEGNTEPTVINPDENTEDLGLEVESPLDSDLGSESLDGDGLNDGGINGDAVDDLDAGSDRPHLDDPDPQPDNDINNAIDENISPILEQLEPIDPGDLDLNDLDSSDLDASDLDPSDLDPSDIETDTDFNLDGRQIDDLNEAIGEDLVPPLIDFLQNGIELQVEPPTTGPNPPIFLPPRPPVSAPSGARPPFGGTPLFENAVLTPNAMANPTVVRGISGGPLRAGQVAGRAETATGICIGFVDREPDHQIELTAFFDYLSLQVESPADTVLVVRGPGGSWCNDDVQGFNPGLAGEWFSGTYDIWIGSYDADTYHPYVIRFTDIQTGN